jgi:3-oxoacyl-[acyl-carrier protein] reductase
MGALKRSDLLDGQIAIVTGASGVIGGAIARAMGLAGASLVVLGRSEDKLRTLQQQLAKDGIRSESVVGDVTNPDDGKRCVNFSEQIFGGVDILVNCAGIIRREAVEETSFDLWNEVLDVNIGGSFLMCKAVLPVMIKSTSGKIINVSSQMASMPHPGSSPSYGSSKAAQESLTRNLAYHYAPYNIRVNSLAPGSINTPLANTMNLEMKKRLKDLIPLGRLGEPNEVANAALFLASNMSSYVTGTTLHVNGGSFMT